MLDVHATLTTPGAALVLGVPGTAPVVNDGAQVAGVPIQPTANLRMWGFHSPTADTIATVKLQSQDQVDPINGVTVTPGVASLLVQYYDYTTLPYVKGARQITAGTNTGVVAGHAFTIDEYAQAQTMAIRRSAGGEVMTGAVTFSGALTANQWGQQAYTPVQAIPTGKYVILGVFVSAITNVGLIRFGHADFKGLKPGFPVANWELGLATTIQVAMRDDLIYTDVGEQFIRLGEVFGNAQCPVFSVSNAGTGLTIEMLCAQADTPVVNLVLLKVA